MKYVKVKRLNIDERVRKYIFDRDLGCCRYCGKSEPPFHIDHVYPVSKGGETTIENLVLACKMCNNSKRAKIIFPKPIGYFLDKSIVADKIGENKFSASLLNAALAVFSMAFLVFGAVSFFDGNIIAGALEILASFFIAIPLGIREVIKNYKDFYGE